jgi:hypothetical protein
MDLVQLLCRIISQEQRREIKEEALLVCIAVLLGGNPNSQEKFYEYIKQDNENEFIRAIQYQLNECFDVLKKS